MNVTQIRTAAEGARILDAEVRGLELRVRGGRKAFYLWYTTKAGRRGHPKLGEWPGLTLPKAREVAQEMLVEVARGGDPSADRKVKRAAETIRQLGQRYIDDHAKEHKRSWRRDQAHIDRVLVPRWGDKPVRDLTEADVQALRKAMRKTPVAFNRVRATLSTMLNFARIEPNPVRHVPRYKETERRRYLEADEPMRLAKALDEVEPVYPHQVAVIRLLLLSGARLSEIIRAKRAWYRGGVLTLQSHKTSDATGAKEIVFSPAAQAVIEAVDPRNGWLVGFSSYPALAWDMVRTKARLADFHLHDLRHSFASWALGRGYSLAMIGEHFGHRDPQTTRRYAHLLKDKRRAMVLDVADQITAEMTRRPA